VDELVQVRRSRRARRWTIEVPWGAPATLTVPLATSDAEIGRLIELHRDWLRAQRAQQSPQLGLDARRVSELEAQLPPLLSGAPPVPWDFAETDQRMRLPVEAVVR